MPWMGFKMKILGYGYKNIMIFYKNHLKYKKINFKKLTNLLF